MNSTMFKVENLTYEEAKILYEHLSNNDIEVVLVSMKFENSNKGYHNEYYVNIMVPERE